MPLASSLRRAMPASICRLASWSLSLLKAGCSSRSIAVAKTLSKSPFKLFQFNDVVAPPPPVSRPAAFASRRSSSTSPLALAVPLVRHVCPYRLISPELNPCAGTVAVYKYFVGYPPHICLGHCVHLLQLVEELPPVAKPCLILRQLMCQPIIICQSAQQVGLGARLVARQFFVRD